MKKSYYVNFDPDTQNYEVIDCTSPVKQPVIKAFKYGQSAYKFYNKLLMENITCTKNADGTMTYHLN